MRPFFLRREGAGDGEDLRRDPSRHDVTALREKNTPAKSEPQMLQQSSLSHPPNIARRLSSMAAGLADSVQSRVTQSRAEQRDRQHRSEQRKILQERMEEAASYQEWEAAAHELDDLEGNEIWKASNDDVDFYNPELIAARLQDLEDAQQSSDICRMMYLVRTSLSRDVGGISSAALYSHTHTGTKHLVERYIKASVSLIHTLVDRSRHAAALPKDLTHREMLDQLLLARRSFGRSALILSGGSVYGMAHIGVLKALFERSLLPRIISGTSAGSIIAAVVCTRTDEEIPALLERFAHGDLAVFTDEDNPDSWLTHIARALRYGAWHDSRHIARVMSNHLGDLTFQEAYNRTRRVLNITVSSMPGLLLPSLLNYMTAPDVIIWSAVVASCSIPGIFDARPLLVRDAATGAHVPWDPAEQLWIDGSIDNDVPVGRLGEILNVNHFIVSQANPHIVLFVGNENKPASSGSGAASTVSSARSHIPSVSDILHTIGWLSKSEAIYYLETLADMGIFRGGATMLQQMLTQSYTADINIIPRMSLWWGKNLIRNPTPEFMLEACRVGEKATWPCITRIEQACAVELALDQAVYALRERIAFSDSQVNLRRFFTGSYELGVRGHSFNGSGSGALSTDGLAAVGLRARGGTTDRTDVDSSTLAPDMYAMTSPSRSRSPIAHRHSLYHHNQRRHKRRGSGGSIQLSARRRHNRYALETILSEDGGGAEHGGSSDESTLSLAARRGMADMHLPKLLHAAHPPLMRSVSYGAPGMRPPPYPLAAASWHNVNPLASRRPVSAGSGADNVPNHLTPPYLGAMRQDSLQQLPISAQAKNKTPSPTASFTRKGYNWGLGDQRTLSVGGGISPLTSFTQPEAADDHAEDDDDGSPFLQMPAHQRRLQRRSSSSSAVSAVGAVAAAAVAAAHKAVVQAVGSSTGSGEMPPTMSYPQTPHAAWTPLGSSSMAMPTLSRVSSTKWYPGVLEEEESASTSESASASETGSWDAEGSEGMRTMRAMQAMRATGAAEAAMFHDDDDDAEDAEYEEDEDETSADLEPYDDAGGSNMVHAPQTPPPRHVRLMRRCNSVPAMVMNRTDEPRRRHVTPQTLAAKLAALSDDSSVNLEHDHTDDGSDDMAHAESDGDDVFRSSGRASPSLRMGAAITTGATATRSYEGRH